jgi:hypothetical protein
VAIIPQPLVAVVLPVVAAPLPESRTTFPPQAAATSKATAEADRSGGALRGIMLGE